jgi:AraC-like DNA-binding protein
MWPHPRTANANAGREVDKLATFDAMTHRPARQRHVNEAARYWTDESLGHLELLRASFVTHAFAPHTHDGFAIGVIESGTETFLYRRQRRVAPAGSIVLINPGELHTGEALSQEGWRYRMLYPDAGVLQRAASELAGQRVGIPFFPEPVVRDAATARLLLQLHTAIERGEAQLERESRLLWTMAVLIARHADARLTAAAGKPEPGIAQRARAYLDAHLGDNITLDVLSRQVDVSAFHLVRVFRREVGLPPHGYLVQARVARAKVLLRHGTPIADVAHEVGFSDQSHLTRHFKRIVGVTPGQFVTAQ